MIPNYSILIIEDDFAICSSLKSYLEIYHVIEIAPDLAAARKKITEKRYDLILLDKSLPDGDGISFLPELKEAQAHAAVIILTGDGNYNVISRALDSGADDYVLKSDNFLPNLLIRFPVAIKHARDRQTVEELFRRPAVSVPSQVSAVNQSEFSKYMASCEREFLEAALNFYGGDVMKVATALGIARSTLFRKITDLGMQKRPWTRRTLLQNNWEGRL